MAGPNLDAKEVIALRYDQQRNQEDRRAADEPVAIPGNERFRGEAAIPGIDGFPLFSGYLL